MNTENPALSFSLNANFAAYLLENGGLSGIEHTDQPGLVGNAPQVENWEILARLPAYDPLESVHVTDDDGLSLEIRYDQLDAMVLPPRDGLATIVLSLDLDFDPAGPKSHLYNAVAENVIFTVLGGWPQELSRVVLLPRAKTGALLPLETLRNQWLDVVVSNKSA
jgi:hypothetical protein